MKTAIRNIGRYDALTSFAFVIPALTLFSIFYVYTFFDLIRLSFVESTGLPNVDETFVWFKHYIELFQDIPVLLQLFFWYAFFYEMLPSPRQAVNPFEGLFLCNRGLIFGIPAAHPVYKYMATAVVGELVQVGLDDTGRNHLVDRPIL